MTKFICETKNLSKKYKDFYALKNVNLTIPKGEIYGLVGENGAGKTTLIRLLTGLNFKSEGEIILFGHTDNLQYERPPALHRLKCLFNISFVQSIIFIPFNSTF